MAVTNKEIVEAMTALSHAMHNLTCLWSDVTDEQDKALGTKYPFDESFDEIVCDVAEWAEEVEVQLGVRLKEKS